VTETPRSTVVIWIVAAVLAVLAAWRLLGAGGGAEAPPVRVDGPAAAARPAGSPKLHIHVAGAVRRPGLLRLPADARVAVALERAGGPTPRADLAAINLAAKLQDGQQIVVPVRGAGAAGGAAGGAPGPAAGAAPGQPIHLSTATVEQLDEIDGIGPTLAERIVEYRDSSGGLSSLGELSEVEGIGEKRLATLREALQP
jgi:competence protein ComEA